MRQYNSYWSSSITGNSSFYYSKSICRWSETLILPELSLPKNHQTKIVSSDVEENLKLNFPFSNSLLFPGNDCLKFLLICLTEWLNQNWLQWKVPLYKFVIAMTCNFLNDSYSNFAFQIVSICFGKSLCLQRIIFCKSLDIRTYLLGYGMRLNVEANE